MATKKTKSTVTNLRLLAEIIVILAGVSTIISLGIQINELKNDKPTIYEYLRKKLEARENTINNLRSKIVLSEDSNEDLKVVYGKISTNKNPIADVKIEVEGGSQVYSNSNGEFLISCRIGQTIRFEKKGYRTHKFIVDKENFNQYHKITLEEA